MVIRGLVDKVKKRRGEGFREEGEDLEKGNLFASGLVAGGLLAWHEKVFTASSPVPALTGQTLTQAKATAAKDHFTLHVENGQKSITVGNGIIISQSPHAGKVL